MNVKTEYEHWLKHANADMVKELSSYSEQDIEDSFYKNLSFGTGGLRGTIAVSYTHLRAHET